jgi:hypothetical protein
MRQLSSLVIGVFGVGLLVAGSATTASAAPGKEGLKNAATPSSSAAGTGGEASNNNSPDNQANGLRLLPQGANPDLVNQEKIEEKAWEVGGSFEAHHLVIQEDTNSARYKQFNVAGLYAQYDLSQYDRVRVRWFVDEYFLADQGETGFRLDDIFLQYARRVPLPHQFTLRLSVQTSIPTSFQSTLTSEITSPGFTISLEKKVGRYIDLNGHGGGTYLIDNYATALGGAQNAMANLNFGGGVDITMPFHEPLSIGFDGGTGYTWFYQPNTVHDPNTSVQANGTTADPQFSSQPISQTYFGEIYLRYILPTVFGVRSDVLVAYADGDPTIGSISVLHEGVGHFYGFFRDSSEVYAALSAAY